MNKCFSGKSRVSGLVLILLSACGKSKEEAKTVPVVETYFVAVAEQVKVGEPYYVRLKWATSENPLLWILDRFEKGTGYRDSIVVNGSDREFIDTLVAPGKLYTYYLVAQAPYKFGLKTQVLIPHGEDN